MSFAQPPRYDLGALASAQSVRQHASMLTTQGESVADIAAGLDDNNIHVWLLDYQRARGREPLRAMLGAYLGIPADQVVLVEGAHGRPELAKAAQSGLRFNWSHSGHVALVAVARGIVPGVDIEQVRPRPHAMQLAKRFFHPEEASVLTSLNEMERQLAFLRLWTGKEAVLKAVGRGIAFGLDRLRLAVTPTGTRLLWLDGEDVSRWQLHGLPTDDEHVASIAWRGPERAVGVWTLACSA